MLDGKSVFQLRFSLPRVGMWDCCLFRLLKRENGNQIIESAIV